MNTKLRALRNRWILLSMILGVAGLSFVGWRAVARQSSVEKTGAQNGLASLLRPDGSLKPGINGSFNASGYRMETTENGTPRFVPTAAQPGCNGWDTQFSVPNGVNGNVNALVVSGMDIYVGGQFQAAGNIPANNVAKFNTATNTWSALGTGGGNGINGAVNALALIGSDLYTGGFATSANVGGPTVTVNNLAKVNLTTGTWSNLGAGGIVGLGRVFALIVNGSDLYVGGEFLFAGNIAANRVAKLDTLANVWSALGSGGGNGVDQTIYAMAISGDYLYVGGGFTTVNMGGLTVSANRVAKFNTVTHTWSSLGAGGGNGVDRVVDALAAIGSDLYVGGGITTANVGGPPVSVNNIAKFNTLTNAWSALGMNGGNGVNGGVSILTASGSDLYVGGGFTTTNVGGSIVSVSKIVKFNTVTGIWSALGTGGGNGLPNGPGALVAVGSDLYVGGYFSTVNVGGPTINVSNLAKVNAATGTWSALDTGSGNGVNATVKALVINGSDLYVGGEFTTVGSVTASRVARFNTATGTWSALGISGGNGVNSRVLAFTIANVGGSPIGVNNLARFNITTGTWSALGTGGGNGVSGSVSALAVNGSDLYVGGDFKTVNIGGPIVSANRVAKFNTATSIWSALGTGGGDGVNASVYALVVSGGDLYVGGLFNTANLGGTAISANYVAKFNTLTNTWSALGTGGGNGVNNSVYALAVSGGHLYVGGNFTEANTGGQAVSVNNIATFSIATGIWSGLGMGGGNGVGIDYGASALVIALAINGNDLYVSGAFTVANVGGPTVATKGFAKFNTATGAWNNIVDVNGGDGGGGSVLAVNGSTIYVGGSISVVGDNKVSQNIGRFCDDASVAPTIMPVANTLGAGSSLQTRSIATVTTPNQAVNTLTVTANGGASATINGVTVSGISVNAAGQVTANIAAAANATTANFTFRVTDSVGAFAEATLTVTIVNFSGSVSDPLVCTGPGNTVGATLVLGNPNGAPLSVSDTTTFTNLIGVPGSCTVTPNVGTCTVTNANLTYTATLAANQAVTITYLTQVADNVTAGTQVCTNNAASFGGGAPVNLQICGTINCPVIGPGFPFNAASPINDQRAGAVLIYNVYTSATDPTRQNTRLSITNVDPGRRVNVHLFFIDGASCSVADSYLCLTPNQTTSFLASDLDPGTTGYVVAVATDASGCPINFNFLIGDEYVKFASGHAANLGAEAITALAGGLPFCDQNASTATLSFDGISYSAVPRVLALDNVPSRSDGNDTLLIVNRIGGNLATGASTLGTLFGIFYNDTENSLSFSVSGTCQLRNSLSNNFPRTAPRFEQFIPAGRSGWMKFYSQGDIGITGAAINFNPNAGTNANAFNQGHNLHALTLTSAAGYSIPVFPAGC